jgi:hypothetical protein
MTSAEAAFGRGIDFEQDWDIKTRAGSFGIVSGSDVLGRDLGFMLMRRTRDEGLRGQRFDPDLREDIRIVVRNVTGDMDRIESVSNITITPADEAGRTAEVALAVIGADGDRGEFVFAV